LTCGTVWSICQSHGGTHDPIYLLIREDQNQHGFVDAGVHGAFRQKEDAETRRQIEVRAEREKGVWVEGEDGCPVDDWHVAFRVEEHALT